MPATNVAAANYRVVVNSFALDPNTTETLGIQGTPVRDQAGRTVTYTRWHFRFRTVLYARKTGDTTTDFQMNSARQLILSPGGSFEYTDRGFGELSVNTNRRQRDAKWGPFVTEISWEPWGDANAGCLEFTVEVCIPECNSARFEDKVMAWNYAVTYERDADGFTTRKISGYLEIPQTRDAQGNRKFRHSADEYREKVSPRVPVGFRPLGASFKLSEDKCRLDFGFADEEMGNEIPPPGVLRLDAEMDTSNERPMNFVRYIYTLSATYTMARGFPSSLAHVHFKRLADNRREAAIRESNAIGGAEGALDLQWRVGEPRMYGKVKQARFSLTFVVTRSRAKALHADGFFHPVPDSNWQLWAASLVGKLFKQDGNDAKRGAQYRQDVRGQAGMYFAAADDVIVDLCQKDVPPGGGVSAVLRTRPVAPRVQAGKLKATVDPDWVLFEQSFRVEPVAAPYVHKGLDMPLTTRLRSAANARRTTTARLRSVNLHGGGNVFSPGGTAAVEQSMTSVVGERTAATYYLIHEGRAVRVGRPVACPVVKAVGPLQAVPANRKGDGFVWMWVKGSEANIFVCRWRMRYLVQGRPGVVGSAPNDVFDEGPTGTKLKSADGGWGVKMRSAGGDTGPTTAKLKGGGGLPF